jgi:hypothetical protein
VAANLSRDVKEWQPRISAAKKQEMPQARHKGAKSSSIREKAGSNVYTSLLPGIPSAPGGNKDYGIALSGSLQFQELPRIPPNSVQQEKTRLENSLETFVFKNPSIGLRENYLSILPFRLVEPFPISVSHPAK